jgi:hypothetical protein
MAVGAWLLFVGNRSPGTAAALHGFPLDDAWIHLVYARNLVEQGGLYYNNGVPEAGMTSPLWVLLTAGVYALTAYSGVESLVLGIKLLSLGFGIASVMLLYWIGRDLGEGRVVALLAAALAATDASLTFAMAAGMEVSLFICLVLLALHSALRGRLLTTAFAAGFSVVARPEGVVLFPLFLALLLRRELRGQPGYARRVVVATVLAVSPGLAYVLFCVHATGAPLPNTFYAKFVADRPAFLGQLAFGWRNYVHTNLAYFTLESGSMLALLGVARLVYRRGWLGLAAPAAGVLLFVAGILSRSYAPGHHFYWERWLIPSFPFLILVMAAGVGEIRDRLPLLRGATAWLRARAMQPAATQAGDPHERSGPRMDAVWAALAWAACGLLVLPAPRLLRQRSDLYAWNCQNIEEMNVELGRWVDGNIPADAVVAVGDAGAIKYFGQRTTVDLFGLNDHRMLTRSFPERFQLLHDLGARYLILFPFYLNDDWMRFLHLTQVRSVHAPHYTICDSLQDTMVVYEFGRQ